MINIFTSKSMDLKSKRKREKVFSLISYFSYVIVVDFFAVVATEA